jgi:hypothetical protein
MHEMRARPALCTTGDAMTVGVREEVYHVVGVKAGLKPANITSPSL